MDWSLECSFSLFFQHNYSRYFNVYEKNQNILNLSYFLARIKEKSVGGAEMLLYHYTNSDDMDSFVQKGLIFGSEVDDTGYGYGTGPINGVLNPTKPDELPAFINRDACVFFYPACKYHHLGRGEIKVDTESLEKDRLFVADLKKAQQIWEDTVHASHSGEVSDIPLSESAKGYWDSLVPFAVYQENPQLIKDPEVLYFGAIPFPNLEISTELHPIVQRVFCVLGRQYRTMRKNLLSGCVYLNERQYVTVKLSPFTGKLIVSSKTGAIEKEFITFLEEAMQFKAKKIEKNGQEMWIKYQV